MSKITSGSSAVTARPIASPLSAMPGPLDPVTPMAPPKAAPIAAVTAAIGAAFGGAIGVTASSGPGIALKGEAIGLAVTAELPLVIFDIQRGGPSTGLPTKTEQADLMQALYGRNSESP